MTDIVIKQGATFRRTYRWVAPPAIFKDATIITGVPLTVTATAHLMPDQWPAQLLDPDEATQVSACDNYTGTVIDANTIQFNDVIDYGVLAGDARILRYLTPVDLTGFSAELQIRSSVRASTALLTVSSQGINPGILLDNAARTIVVSITPAQTAALTFSNAVFQLELTSGSGDVTRLDEGAVTLSREVVRV